MQISLAASSINGFRKWSKDRSPSCNDDENPGGATPIAVVESAAGRKTPNATPHRPWVVPGVGGSF
jgi:hypothetical protein